MTAIRTVSETDDVHVIEGLGVAFGGPFPGDSDSYGTRASRRTNFHWDLYPDRTPEDPPDVAARFVRPLNYQHGFDDQVGLTRIGGWSPVRVDKRGVWIQAQLDKHHAYYEQLRAMLGEDALGFSPESSEHAVRFSKTGEWLDWPMLAEALTPTPSNPWNTIAARAAQVIRVSGLRAENAKGEAAGPPEGGKERKDIPDEDFAGPDHSFPIVNQASVDDAAHLIGKAADPDAVKAKIIAIAKRKGLSIPEAWRSGMPADDAGCAANILSSLSYLMGCESDEPDQLAMLRDAFECVTKFLEAEQAEIGGPDDEGHGDFAYYSAVRIGKRNSSIDLGRIDAIHDHTVALGASAHMTDDASIETTAANDADGSPSGRSAEGLPIRVTGLERLDAKSLRKAIRRAAKRSGRIGAEVGTAEARRLLG